MVVAIRSNLESNTLAGIARLGPERREVAMEYYRSMLRKGITPSTCSTYLHFWTTLESIGKPYKEMTEDDLKEWLLEVVERYAPSTATLLKTKARKFFQWINYGERAKKGQYPPVVDWIEVNNNGTRKRLPRALSKDQVVELVSAARNERDRALFFVTYDSGGRASEVLSACVGDVQPDQYGARLRLEGKTGTRLVRLIDSWPDLQRWMEFHPQAKNASAPLWPSQSTRSRGRPDRSLDYSQANRLIKEAAERAGISGVVTFHTLRHSKATHLASHLTEAQMRLVFGWTPGSPMPAVYVHLSGRDSDLAQLKAAGIVVEGAREEDMATRPKVCPRCRTESGASARFCPTCSMVLDQQLAAEMSANTAELQSVGVKALKVGGLAKAFEDPETAILMEALLERLKAK